MECLFCQIVAGTIPAYKIYEDEYVLAFLDIHPHAKGHTVVIPKVHGETIFDFSEKEITHLWLGVRQTMEKIEKVLQPAGFNVGWNHKSAGGQVIPHWHIHPGDGGGSIHSVVKHSGDLSLEEVAKLFQ
jgi:histidine triad (HIT) family protein